MNFFIKTIAFVLLFGFQLKAQEFKTFQEEQRQRKIAEGLRRTMLALSSSLATEYGNPKIPVLGEKKLIIAHLKPYPYTAYRIPFMGVYRKRYI